MGPLLTDQEAFDQLSYYTLSHGDPSFIHQLVVDAYAAQHASEASKPIYAAFALAGLCLHNERGLTGKEVQLAHMRLARHKKDIPLLRLPPQRGTLTVHDVLAREAGGERDVAIEMWSATTWEALAELHEEVERWLRSEKEI